MAITDKEVKGNGRVQNAFFRPPVFSFACKELRFIHPAFSKAATATTTTTTTITTTITTTTTTTTVITINYNMKKRETYSKILI